MSRIRAYLILGLMIVVVAGLVFRGVSTDPPLAELGRETIRESDFLRYLESLHPPEDVARIRREPLAKSREFEDYLDARAIAEKARRERLESDVRFAKAVELMETRTLAQLAMEPFRMKLTQASSVSAEEVRDYYEQHQQEFAAEPLFTAHHLLVYVVGNPAFPERGLPARLARAKAERALERLRRGASWSDVAKAYSDDIATRERAGLLRDRQFGYFAPEVEQVLRTQPLGHPSGVIETSFGYYVVEVVTRVTEQDKQPFDAVREMIRNRLAERRLRDTRAALLEPIRRQVGFEWTNSGLRDAPLFDAHAVPPETILAKIGTQPIRESDFVWFCRDALLPRQRAGADARPGARQGLLDSYLDMSILAAKARIDHLDATPLYARRRATQLAQLRAEFVRAKDASAAPAPQAEGADASAERTYLDRLRAEVGLRRIGTQRK